MDIDEAVHLKTSSNQHKLRYHYRQFDFNLQSLKDHSLVCATKVNLTKIHCDSNTLGLIMTYYINYGLSTRKTALILKQVHGITISHQTVANYAQSVASLVKPLVDSYQHKDISPTLVGDETYIKVRSKNHYVFFFSDPVSKAILSYEIFKKRDTEAACISMWNVLKKFKNAFPDDLTFITDGNPIYNAAQLFFKMQDISFDLLQVIGVSNKDELSKKYRSFKQIEERLNRTYKQNYHGTNGYHSLHSANSYMVAYVAFFNFLRPHSALNYATPLQLDCFNSSDLMPDKWIKLLHLSASYSAS
ncbi:MAG: IS6 family transposase [Culicoidibacterales bacterium]